jgi:hypothetical protein
MTIRKPVSRDRRPVDHLKSIRRQHFIDNHN